MCLPREADTRSGAAALLAEQKLVMEGHGLLDPEQPMAKAPSSAAAGLPSRAQLELDGMFYTQPPNTEG